MTFQILTVQNFDKVERSWLWNHSSLELWDKPSVTKADTSQMVTYAETVPSSQIQCTFKAV